MSNFYTVSSQSSSILSKEKYEQIVKKIPINPIVTDELLKELKAVPEGEKPLDLIFVIKYKNSSNNRIYTTECYQSIVKQILSSSVIIPVCYGHQSNEEFNYKARQIAGSVIGALLDEKEELIYYRVIPDSSPNNADIRKWLRNKQLNALSIWGIAEGSINVDGVEVITDFLLRSIDLVPPLSEGQPNVDVIIGEQIKNYPNNINNSNSTNNSADNKEQNMSEIDLKQLDNNVLLSEVKNRLIDGRMALEKAGGELESAGLILSKSIEEIKIKNATFETEREAIFNELKELNITTIEGLINYIQENKQKAKDTKDKEEFDKNYSDILKEKGLLKDGKPTGAMYEVVNKWAGCKIGMTKGEMSSCIDKVLNDEHFKKSVQSNVGSPNLSIKSSGGEKSEDELYSI